MISIIIPAYNCMKSLSFLVPDLYPLDYPAEILLINDGSTDHTAEVCRTLSKKYSEVVFIDKPHTGVSDTRNTGIRAAKGKYILFLDADDELKKGSVKALVDFFDGCGEDVDLITYPIETHYRGNVLQPHFRYKTMCYSGIYDLNTFPYIGQTTMNIAVRNKFADNVLFDTSMIFSEDQKYCCDVVKHSMKIGFCKEAKYIYNRSDGSSSGKINGACYIFEQSMKMFEDMFRGCERVPAAFQGLFVNDLAWKLRADILYPYHYDEKSFQFAVDRIRALLARVDADVILNHPDIDYFHKFYWLSLKPDAKPVPYFEKKEFGLRLDGRKIYCGEKFEIVVVRIRLDAGKLVFRGFIKTPIFGFSEMPVLFAVINGEKVEQRLFLSAHSYYFSHTQTNCFYGFCVEVSADTLKTLRLEVKAGGVEYNCTYVFMPKSPFSHRLKRCDSVIGGRHIHYDINRGEFSWGSRVPEAVLRKNSEGLLPDAAAIRRKAVILKQKEKIHLYYDCRGVEKDNGYYKFLEDWGKNDGVTRKYIYDPQNKNIKKLFDSPQRKDLIPFGSRRHKIYFLAAEKIFTAYIEDINLFPFPADEFDVYSDFFGFEVWYLQHGILHGCLPWKYTPEKIFADKVLISTDYEQRLFTEKYHFRDSDLIGEKMPRLKLLDKKVKPEKKILFAPSWRQYLIGPDIDGVWQPEPELFLQSDYYKNICGLLHSEKLKSLLEEKGYVLEFKLHPIFAVYGNLFALTGERVKMIYRIDRIEKYEMFITDFSSFAFDFLYLGRKVFSFIPDEMQFKSGMNGYREIEEESEKSFVKLKTAEDVVKLFDGRKNDIRRDDIRRGDIRRDDIRKDDINNDRIRFL